MKFIYAIFFILFCTTASAQQELNNYLRTHSYSFSLDKGFDQAITDTLKLKLKNYKLILQAEGGSHDLAIYEKLPVMWVNFLHTNFGLKHLFLEFSHASAVCVNKFLASGDSTFLYSSNKEYWQQYRNLNTNSEPNNQVHFFGIDFNKPSSYLKALRLLLPLSQPPENIKNDILLISNSDNSVIDCDNLLNINASLKKGISNYKSEYEKYLGTNYNDFGRIIESQGTCKDAFKNRNNNIAENFLSFDYDYNDPIYYGELGMAHTILKNKVAASIINNSPKFKDKVCVINLYCYNCTTEKEEVSNWPLKKIEEDIQKYFLQFCTSDFTLFDLSENNELINKYKEYGQFLIIAKDQN